DVRRDHCAHTEVFCGEIACETADVKGGDGSIDCIRTIFERAVGLREEAGDEPCQRVAGAGSAEPDVAGRVDEHTAVRRGYEWARAFENEYDVIGYGKLARGRNTIVERGFVFRAHQPKHLAGMRSQD